jgi:hypothetical protein
MNPDRNIDRVLDALRNAAPPAGMERRILNMLEIEACRPVLSMRSGRKMWMTVAACCAGLVIAALIGAFTLQRHSAPVVSTTPISPAQPSDASRSSVATVPKIVKAAPPLRPRSATEQRSAQPRRIEVAESEDTPVSHPAPPIPLTEQERILLRYARRGSTGDLAQISNDRKAVKEDQEKQEFQAFFEPPPIKIGESE